LHRFVADLLSQIDPKRAIPRDEQERTSKIFVGGVSQEATEGDFKSFFMQFGRVLDATLMMDKDTGRPRGFGFVTFDSEAAVDRTLQGPLAILDKPIEVKKAQPRGNIEKDDDSRGRFGRNKNNFNNRDQGYNNQQQEQGPAGPGGNAGMTPNMMAQYWARMQQYFQMMQQQMMQGGGMNPMAAMQQNPAMMQQMMAMQNNMKGGMNMQNPQQMMQQMQQMQQMSQGGGGGYGMSNSGMDSPGPSNMGNGGGGNRPAFNPSEQMAFEQQKYERQASLPSGGGGGRMGMPFGAQSPQSGGANTSWEGMYDDVPAPQQGNGGGFRGRGGYRGGRGGGGGNYAAGQAPANAPTGPKNAGRGGGGGGNYRGGGGRGGHRGGFHPYARGN